MPAGMSHTHASAAVDGAATPELIPDSTAYRLFLLGITLPRNPTAIDISSQQIRLRGMALSSKDEQSLTAIVNDFRAKYEALIKDYNEAEHAAELYDHKANYNQFLLQRDELVRSTRDLINATLMPASARQLDDAVRNAKRNMKLGMSNNPPATN
jgi:hypothetical protein